MAGVVTAILLLLGAWMSFSIGLALFISGIIREHKESR